MMLLECGALDLFMRVKGEAVNMASDLQSVLIESLSVQRKGS